MIQIKEAPEGAMLSKQYEVFVNNKTEKIPLSIYTSLCCIGSGCDYKLPADMLEEFDEISQATMLSKAYFAEFSSDECVSVTVVYHGETVPEIVNKECIREMNKLTFDIEPGEVVTIKPNIDFSDNLRVICDKIDVFENVEGNVIEFKPGYYNIENCEYITKGKKGFPIITNIPDGTTLYLHKGAVVNASFVLENAHDIKICGTGVISTIERAYGAKCNFEKNPLYGPLRKYAYPAIFIKTNSSNISVEGVTLNCEFRGIAMRNSEDISVSGVKIFTNCINADGVNLMNVRRIKVENTFIHSQDDCIAVFTSRDSILYLEDSECKNPLSISSDIEISHCNITTPCRPFVIGGHATGNTNPHDCVKNFYAHDIEVTNYRYYDIPDVERVKKWSGFLRILSQTEQLISNIKFKNIKCTKRTDYEGQPIHIEIRGNMEASYTEKSGYRIENLVFENVEFQKRTSIDLPSALYSGADNKNEDYCIDGVLFKNVTFGGIPMEDTDEYLEKIGLIKNVVVE